MGGFIIYRVHCAHFFMLVYEGVIREHGDTYEKPEGGLGNVHITHAYVYKMVHNFTS